MGKLNGKGDLSAAEIAFFSPALIISIFVVVRHGFSRQAGWLYLCILSILRLIGSSCTLYAETQNDNSTSLQEAAAITSAVGTAPLLLALLGFLERVNQGMGQKGFSKIIFRALRLVGVVALVLAIVGGTDESKTNLSSISTGHDLMEAASIIFMVIYLSLAALTIIHLTRKSHVVQGDQKLLYAGLAALPFLLVRVIFTIIVSFAKSPHSDFYFRNVNVWAESFMQFLMEVIVVILFAIAGLMTPKQADRDANKNIEIISGPNADRVHEMESGRAAAPPSQRQEYQQPRSLGDYRPSRMIRNAISSR